jgi:hypothetical protein
MKTYSCKVTGTSDRDHGGVIRVVHPDLNAGNEFPAYYASPFGGSDYGFFAVPGKGADVLVTEVDGVDGTKMWVWFASVYLPGKVSRSDVVMDAHDRSNSSKLRQYREGDNYADVPDSVGFGNPNPDDSYGDNDLPEKYILKSPKGHSLELAEKNTGKVNHNYAKLESASGKKLILDDNPANAAKGINPLSFTNPRNPNSNVRIEYKGNKILLVDAMGNRVVIDQTNQTAEIFAKNGTQVHSEGGLVSLKAENPKSFGQVEVGNHSIGNTKVYANQGSADIFGQLGFSIMAEFTPALTPAPAIVGTTGSRNSKLEKAFISDPELIFGIGVPSLDSVPGVTFPSTSYQKMTLEGTELITPKLDIKTGKFTIEVGEISITTPSINIVTGVLPIKTPLIVAHPLGPGTVIDTAIAPTVIIDNLPILLYQPGA